MSVVPIPVASRASRGRRPRAWITINGMPIDFISCEVESCATLSADKFSVELDVWRQPQGFNATYFSSDQFAADTTFVEIWFGYLEDAAQPNAKPGNLVRFMKGRIDEWRAPLTGGNATIMGRDRTADLINSQVNQNYSQVSTAAQIVSQLAASVGLTAIVQGTTQVIGQPAQVGYAALTLGLPAWEVVAGLAAQEGFDAWVDGDKLYFQPQGVGAQASQAAGAKASGVAGGLAIYVQEDAAGRIVSNATRIEARRAYTMDDPFVRVSSHSIAAGGPSTATSGSQASATQNFEISRPNLTGSQAAQIANSVRQAAQRHGYVLEVEMEGDTTTSPRMALNLSGTGTNMDGGYKIDMVTRHFSFTGGFSQHIRAVTPDQGGASAPGPQTDPDVGLPQDDGDPQEPP